MSDGEGGLEGGYVGQPVGVDIPQMEQINKTGANATPEERQKVIAHLERFKTPFGAPRADMSEYAIQQEANTLRAIGPERYQERSDKLFKNQSRWPRPEEQRAKESTKADVSDWENQAKKYQDIADSRKDYSGEPQPDLIRRWDISQAKADLIRSYTSQNKEPSKESQAVLSKELDPYISVDKDSFSIDVTGAVKEKVNKNILIQAGVSESDISEIQRYIDSENKRREQYETLSREFKTNNTQLKDNKWVTNENLQAIKNTSPTAYEILTQQGVDAYEKAIAKAKADLVKYHVEGDRYNLQLAVLDNIRSVKGDPDKAKAIRLLFTEQDINEANRSIPGGRRVTTKQNEILRKLTPVQQSSGKEINPVLLSSLGAMAPASETNPYLALAVALAAIGGYAWYMKNQDEVNHTVTDTVTSFRRSIGRTPTADDIVIVDKTGKAATLSELAGGNKSFSSIQGTSKGGTVFPAIPLPKVELKIYPKLEGGVNKGTEFIPPVFKKSEIPGFTVNEDLTNHVGGALVNWREPVIILPGTNWAIPKRLITDKTTLAQRAGFLLASADKVELEMGKVTDELSITRAQFDALQKAYEDAKKENLDKRNAALDKINDAIERGQALRNMALEKERERIARELEVAKQAVKKAEEQKRGEQLKQQWPSVLARWQAEMDRVMSQQKKLEEIHKRYRQDYQDYLHKRLLYINARKSFIESTNPKPINGTANEEMLNAYADTFAKAMTKTQTQTSTKTQTGTKTQTQTQVQTQTATKTATQTQTETQEQTRTKAQTKTNERTREQTLERTAARTGEMARTAETTTAAELIRKATLTTTLLKKKGKEPPIKVESVKGIPKSNAGPVIWRQGEYWISIEPPYRPGTQDVGYSTKPPSDARHLLRTPQQTLFHRGRPPKEINLGMGIVKSQISHGKRIKFYRQHIKLT